ncbi:lipase family alpha/beta hydrolase [Candidatus Solirubrobacter pratensis]|uniref:lipase family alpha/beta hydrolase n=1 Tax=Candidatus Solirubrobacter pratensis TaxID=1298857 RepID=UPI000402E398|nr:alpha/beta fold hydrolase [Candidatus Solirubrobacter pratensis]
MADAERRALARLLTDEAAAAPGGIGNVHAAIASRVFSALGPAAEPVRVLHDGIMRGSYFGVRAGMTVAGRAAGAGWCGAAPLSTTPRGAAVIAAVNAVRGDVLEREGSPLALPMSARRGGEPVALPSAQRLAVFVHGLGETEFAWGREPYGDRLPGWTPAYLRYNTGRHISENGASLAALLEDVDAEEIALIGHSMGGLVARSACHVGGEWTKRMRVTVSLGSPHFGAPLEQLVHVASAGLHAVPETRPFARLLRRRSAGIRDLRRGSLVDEDWRDQDPDALRARALAEVPLLEGATHCFVAATITRSADHPVGRLLGDMLVLAPSASGRSKARRLFEDETGLALGGTHHLALLNHPAVHEQLLRWLAP